MALVPKGKEGNEYACVTNFHRINISANADRPFFLYSVQFFPELSEDDIALSSLRQKIVSSNRKKIIEALEVPVSTSHRCPPVICTGGNLYVAGGNGAPTLDLDNMEYGGISYKVFLKLNKQLDASNRTEYLMVMNIALKEALRALKFSAINRFQFDPNSPVQVANFPYQLFPGYITSVRPIEANQSTPGGLPQLALNIDISFRILHNSTVLDVMRQNANNRAAVEDEIVGRVVFTGLGDTNHCYRVKQILWDESPDGTTFQDKMGNTLSISQYFKQKYNHQLTNGRQPLLLCEQRRGREVKLPSEICQLTGMTDVIRNNRAIKDAVATHTRMRPGERFQRSRQLLDRILDNPTSSSILKQWNLNIDHQPVVARGRTGKLDDFAVINSSSSKTQFQKTNAKVGNPVNISRINFPHILQKGIIGFESSNIPNSVMGLFKWCLVCHDSDQSFGSELAQAIAQNAKRYGINGEPPLMLSFSTKDPRAFVTQTIDGMKAKGLFPNIVVWILPKAYNAAQGDALYRQIKQVCLPQGVLTQCVKAATLGSKRAQNAIEKVFHQIVSKMGGFLWCLPTRVALPTAIVGVDTLNSHGKTFAGFSAAFDKTFTRHLQRCTRLDTRLVVGGALREFVKEVWGTFMKAYNTHLKRLIIYRDGIPESQNPLLRSDEVAEVRACLNELDPIHGPEVELIYIVVNTSINQRFARKEGASLENPLPLTVFDNGVTEGENKFEFYCAHQEVTQGCVTPTHYNIIEWKTKTMTTDDIQRLTLQLSMLYQNWPGPIRVPSVVMNAKKICRLHSSTESGPAKANLMFKSYYL